MTRSLVVAAVGGLALALATAACGGSSSSSASAPAASSGASAPAASPVGPGCADYARQVPTGPGSVAGMAQDKVAVAASNNPLLKTLVAAVSGKLNPEVNLVETLDSGRFTVFAPVDAAFAKLPAATVNTLETDPGLLTKILTYHVLPIQVSPDTIVGEQKTVEGSTVTVAGTPDSLTVDGVKVICGGIHTANATVYLIDGVLTPQS
jgi:uncharacterized surface protein with fasciclin (FAS1) repeats